MSWGAGGSQTAFRGLSISETFQGDVLSPSEAQRTGLKKRNSGASMGRRKGWSEGGLQGEVRRVCELGTCLMGVPSGLLQLQSALDALGAAVRRANAFVIMTCGCFARFWEAATLEGGGQSRGEEMVSVKEATHSRGLIREDIVAKGGSFFS